MDITHYKAQHVEMLTAIHDMRELAHAGLVEHGNEIAQHLLRLRAVISLHLAREDNLLYPEIKRHGSAKMARMADAFQTEMKQLSPVVVGFFDRWQKHGAIAREPEVFRQGANTVLKALYFRIIKENRQFYPEVEAIDARA